MGLDVQLHAVHVSMDELRRIVKVREILFDAVEKFHDDRLALAKLAKLLDVKLNLYGLVELPITPVTVSRLKPTPVFPDLGYFYSSYGAGGFNNMAQARGFPTLHDLVLANDATSFDNDYYVYPKWEAVLERATEAVELIKQEDKTHMADYLADYVSVLCDTCRYVLANRRNEYIFTWSG